MFFLGEIFPKWKCFIPLKALYPILSENGDGDISNFPVSGLRLPEVEPVTLLLPAQVFPHKAATHPIMLFWEVLSAYCCTY